MASVKVFEDTSDMSMIDNDVLIHKEFVLGMIEMYLFYEDIYW